MQLLMYCAANPYAAVAPHFAHVTSSRRSALVAQPIKMSSGWDPEPTSFSPHGGVPGRAAVVAGCSVVVVGEGSIAIVVGGGTVVEEEAAVGPWLGPAVMLTAAVAIIAASATNPMTSEAAAR
jgi:hypothetical protein